METELHEFHDTKNQDENTNMVSSMDDDIQMLQQQQQQQEPTDFDPMDDTDIWLSGSFSTDFNPLQDFPCMSSSSSTSYSPPTESNPSSWAIPKSDVEQDFDKRIDTIGDQECLNVMDNLGYMDLIDVNEFLDPMISFIHSENENPQEQQQGGEEGKVQLEDDQQVSIFQGDSELALMFFEWLKQNKDYISAEDMRSIKLKRSTIESASKRLGSTKEGKKQLLRLILDWVEQHRLQKKQMREAEAINQQNLQNSAPYNFDPNVCFYPSPWIANTPVYNAPFPESTSTVMAGAIQGYIGDPCSNGSLFGPQTMSGNANSPVSAEYHPLDTSQSWSTSQFTMAIASQYNQFPDNDSTNNVAIADQAQYDPYQLFDGNGERLPCLGPCATKEARKNRMARQRRVRSHHYRHQTRNQQQISHEPSVMMSGEISNCAMSQANNPGNWVCWPSAAAVSPPMMMVPQSHAIERPILQSQNNQKNSSAEKRQALKTEKNLKFLLQKVLKQSDVGNLGRIVLPKREAETHLPQLESRDGISIAMEDIGTSRVWNMKYRFWPNNKSRMYLLENTGDFIRANGLKEGDFIVIYADMKCGKYLIRGVKVRPNGPKSEGKKQAKKNVRKLSSTSGVSSCPVAQAVR